MAVQQSYLLALEINCHKLSVEHTLEAVGDADGEAEHTNIELRHKIKA
ncbi:hypothetical protein [Gloeocapsopsis dulcis]|nr:hypothetical protein [Gloeocapsopsis dulcis]WNN87653.1 hypothetical protein P0S91_15165 [Gloeocapsopsis dulcis]